MRTRITKKLVRKIFAWVAEGHPDLVTIGSTGWRHYYDSAAYNILGADACDWDVPERIVRNMLRWGWLEDRGMPVMTELGYSEF